jgi:hypothetical protein
MKYYKDTILNKEIQDLSGIKTLEQLKKEFNSNNIEDITAQKEAELALNLANDQIGKQRLLDVQALRDKDIIDNLPSWQQVSDIIDSADSLVKLRAIVKKIARITYWLAKNKAD